MHALYMSPWVALVGNKTQILDCMHFWFDPDGAVLFDWEGGLPYVDMALVSRLGY